jgi:hypothetical protein
LGFIAIVLFFLGSIDLTVPEAEPIIALLRGIPQTLRFVLDHNLIWLKTIGMTTAASCATLTALVFGKDEDGGFRFTQQMIDDSFAFKQDMLTGVCAPYLPSLPPYWFRPICYLTISDVNKTLLLQSDTLFPLLLDGLFLDADHLRKDADASEKAPIQADAADAFLQLAVFEPGRERLRSEPAVMDALRALANGGKALTEEVALSARGALLAIEGSSREPEPAGEGGGDGSTAQHVMMSYQWDSQSTIERIVRSLQQRGYAVWYDVDCMKGKLQLLLHVFATLQLIGLASTGGDAGSTVDAMSDAIDSAEVFVYGVSLAYKESGNVSLSCHCSVYVDDSCCELTTLHLPCVCVSVCSQCRLEAN